jgi:hypothetical protein
VLNNSYIIFSSQQSTMATVPSVTANFPTPTFTPFATSLQPPTYHSLQVLARELNGNAQSVHSTGGGGLLGHLTLTVSAAAYLALAGVPFVVPVAPPAQADVPVGSTAAPIADIHRQHQEDQRVFQRYHDVDKALVRLIIAAAPPTYIDALCDPDYGFGAVTTLQLLTHLRTTFGSITLLDRDANLARMAAPWSPPTPIELLFKQLTDGHRMALASGEPIADSQLARLGYNILLKSGIFVEACREWRLKPPVSQTFAEFKLHFLRMDRDRLESVTSASAGYHAAFLVTSSPTPAPAPPSPTILLTLVQPPHPLACSVSPSPTLASVLAELALYKASYPAGPLLSGRPPVHTATTGYCWTHGSSNNTAHTSATCKNQAPGHKDTATLTNKLGGSDKVWTPHSSRQPRS